MEIFGDSDIGYNWRFGYWRYLEIWILGIGYWRLDIGDLEFGDRILEIWILEIAYWRLDIGDLEIFGDWILDIWKLEIGYWRLDIGDLDIEDRILDIGY